MFVNRIKFVSILLLICLDLVSNQQLIGENFDSSNEQYFPATIQIVILIHPYNKVQYLPYCLGSIESQTYPKNRIRIHLITERIFYDESNDDEQIRKDFQRSSQIDLILDERIKLNDQTISMLKRWVKHNREYYNDIELSIANIRMPIEDPDSSYWTREHYSLMIDYKNQELYQAFQTWADWLLFIDADVILTNSFTFQNLTHSDISDLVIVAPMLNSFETYSNFWAGMDEFGYYLRTEDYLPILDRKKKGVFPVPMVHSCVFINTRKIASRLLTFDPIEVEQLQQSRTSRPTKIPYDDIIAFAKSAALNEINLYVDNTQKFGFFPRPIIEDRFSSEEIQQIILDLELDSMVEGPSFPVSPILEQYVIGEPDHFDKLGVDQIYIVNLARRPERKLRMKKCLKKLGIDAKFVNATDGKELTEEYLQKYGIRSLDGYEDPYHKRPITFGEIGCFLSHYRIWEDAYRENYQKIIVLEDDVRFDHNFRSQWFRILERFDSLPEQYDFLYLGRKLNDGKYDEEEVVDQLFVRPRYSYWTIGYMITRTGIEKLLRANPTSRMVPVDEFLPIMYGSHVNDTLIQMYGINYNNNIDHLKALSLRHVIVSPTHYVGDPLYISDTEQSDKVEATTTINMKNSIPIEDPQEIFDEDGINQQNNKHTSSSGLQPPPSSDQMKHFEL